MVPKKWTKKTLTPRPESEVNVIDFAVQTEHAFEGKLEEKRSLRKRMVMLVWNPRARNLRRSLLRRWIER
jgi:hypothetical protein